MKKNTGFLNEIYIFFVGLIGIDRSTWEQIRGTPEGARVLRSAIALVVGPVVFLFSYFSALKVIGVTPILAFFIATFFAMALAVIDQMLFCAWTENALAEQPRLLRYMRRLFIPALLVGMTILGLPDWLGADAKTGLVQAANSKYASLLNASPHYLALKAELEQLQAANVELISNEAKVLTLNTEVSKEKTDMKDEEEGNRLRNGGRALEGRGHEYRHHLNVANEKAQHALELTARNAELKVKLSEQDKKKKELATLETQLYQQAVDQVGNGVAVQLALLWNRMMDGDIMLAITAGVYMLTALAVEAIVYMALSQKPPVNIAQLMAMRTSIVAIKLSALTMEERSRVMNDIPVVKARFTSSSARGTRPTAVPSNNDREVA